MPGTNVSAQQQLVLELINRARLDPVAEGQRNGYDITQLWGTRYWSEGYFDEARTPLAWNGALVDGAQSHAVWMRDHKITSYNEGSVAIYDRLEAAGWDYFEGGRTPVNLIESLDDYTNFPNDYAADLNGTWTQSTRNALHTSLSFRELALGDGREFGWGYATAPADDDVFGNVTGVWDEVHFGLRPTKAFMTGVAFTDRDGDGVYDMGEGRSGVRFDRVGDARAAVVSATAGGYAIQVPSSLDGWASLRVTAGTAVINARVHVEEDNVKVDLVNGRVLATSADLVLGSGGTAARALGIGAIDLMGNDQANTLGGARGMNRLDGRGGDDLLRGQEGNDVLLGGAGHDRLQGGAENDRLQGGLGNDRLWGGVGADRFVFTDVAGSTLGADRIEDLGTGDRIVIDLLGTLPSEAAWKDSHISQVTGGFQIGLNDGTQIFVAASALAALESSLVLI